MNIVIYENKDYVQNVYRFFLNFDYENFESPWLLKIDDDSCTDIGGLLYNLDKFYRSDESIYLGSSVQPLVGGSPERPCIVEYAKELGEYANIVEFLHHEIECCLISNKAIKTILGNSQVNSMLLKRTKIEYGATDVFLAFCSAVAKIYPVDCPFLTHLPLIENFSIFGGIKNHIHMISRDKASENFCDQYKPDSSMFDFLIRAIQEKNTELEKSIENSKFFCDKEDTIELIKFQSNHRLKIKFDNSPMIWMEIDGFICIFKDGMYNRKFEVLPDGSLYENSEKGDFVFLKVP